MSATIDGARVEFSDIRPSMYFHFSVTATSPAYSIRLCLGGGRVGEYTWTSRPCQFLEPDTSAWLNSFLAEPGVGGSTITRSDNNQRVVEGVFAFTVLDTVRQDTLEVKDGMFLLYYPAEG